MARAATTRTPAQMFALVFGVVYLLIGIVGFAVTGFDDVFGQTFVELLSIFALTPAHIVVRLLLGVAWLLGSRTHAAARTTNLAIGAAYLLVFVLGVFGALKWLAIDSGLVPDQWLHLLTGLLAVYFGTAGAGDRARA